MFKPLVLAIRITMFSGIAVLAATLMLLPGIISNDAYAARIKPNVTCSNAYCSDNYPKAVLCGVHDCACEMNIDGVGACSLGGDE